MTSLRLRMTEDMTLAGLAPATQAVYIDAIRGLAAHYWRSPDQLSEEQVRGYLLGLRDRGVALGSFKTNHGAIQFLYRRTLDRDWPLFWKKSFDRPGNGVYLTSCRTLRSARSWAASGTPPIRPASL
jgi:hypothetical protein